MLLQLSKKVSQETLLTVYYGLVTSRLRFGIILWANRRIAIRGNTHDHINKVGHIGSICRTNVIFRTCISGKYVIVNNIVDEDRF